MKQQKNYEELTIRDPFLFGKICSKPENRKLILDSLLQIDFQEKNGEIEKHIQEYKNSKYVRLDLLTEDVDGTIYDAEMQNESNNKAIQEELPKRSRYYQSIIDTAFFKTGMSYIDLPESYIIFICTFDPFGENLPIYHFETTCHESVTVKFDDKVHKIFFNTTADLSNLPQSVRNMLEYIDTGAVNDIATESIDNDVKESRLKEEWRAEYMLTLVHDKDVYNEGYGEGYDSGYDSGYESRQEEIDNLTLAIKNKDSQLEQLTAKLDQLTALLKASGINTNDTLNY